MYISDFHHRQDHYDNEIVKLETTLKQLRKMSKNYRHPTIILGEDAENLNWDGLLFYIMYLKNIKIITAFQI